MKKIIVFADGTGNAFTTQESNVWRLYEALDQSQPDQICHYIPGVGTAGFRPFALLDGATGIGVPFNVRKLYRFICGNWQPGDEIYMFGFSRGSFTIRTLIGLIDHEGLVPAKIDGRPVTHGEMQRNARSAWRSYRAKTVTYSSSFPTVWIARAIRDALLWGYGKIRGLPSYDTVSKASRTNARITFVGLFDTVEAFGVPIEEVRGAIDYAIWPISFRNAVLSDKVDCVRHALSLDDERTTFHPLLFDMTDETTDRIKEVWFSGVHSDVGGGYPDAGLALVPLTWIADESEKPSVGDKVIASGLRYADGAINGFRNAASSFAPLHDSRKGTSVGYRYDPRTVTQHYRTPVADVVKAAIEKDPALKTETDAKKRAAAQLALTHAEELRRTPVIHHSVVEKMVFGSENYAPATLTASARVLMPDERVLRISDVDPDDLIVNAKKAGTVRRKLEPDQKYVDLARDWVWWRRVGYFLLLVAGAVLITLPKTAESIGDAITWILDRFVDLGGWVLSLFGQSIERVSPTDIDHGVSSVFNSISRAVGGFVPGYLAAWLEALVQYPFGSLVVIGAVLGLFWFNGWLRDRISYNAHCAWYDNVPPAPPPGFWLGLARCFRLAPVSGLAHRAFTAGLVPAVFLFVVFLLFVTTISRTTVTYRAEQSGSGEFCTPTADNAKQYATADVLKEGQQHTVTARFRTKDLCWASGIKLEKDARYMLWIEEEEPYFDQSIIADVAGFKFDSWWSYLDGRALFRRWWTAEWFAPIARINATGGSEWPLKAVDNIQPLDIGKEVADGMKKPAEVKRVEHFYDDASYQARRTELAQEKDPARDPSRQNPGLWEMLTSPSSFARTCSPFAQAEVERANKIHQSRDLRRRFVSDFVAPATGELYLYINDAILAVPFGPTVTCFYDNNRGTAKVTIKRFKASDSK